MEYLEFEKMFKDGCERNDIKFSDVNCNDVIKKFYNYMKLLLSWNEKINITAVTEEEQFYRKHLLDSLTIADFMMSGAKLIDVGSGGGLPGIPLKLYNESLNVTLIDSVGKKVNVLNDVIQKLELTDIEALHVRAEDLARDKNYREKFDIAVSRAVANMSTLVEYLLPFVKLNGIVICMKGPNFNEELEEARNAIKILGGKLELIQSINVDEEFERNIIIIRKIKATPEKYPRLQGKPAKEPIK